MKESAGRPPDRVHDFELVISYVLRGGVLLCLLLLAVGSALTFTHHPEYRAAGESLKLLTTPGAAFPHSLRGLETSLRAGRGQGFTTLGLLVLIATPILRVAVSVLAFWFERDRAFVLITTTVLCLLVASLFLGKAGG